MQEPKKHWPLRLLVVLIVGIGAVLMLSGKRPENLGVQNGRLAACPDKPNCVSTQASDDLHQIEPLRMDVVSADTILVVKRAIEALPRTTIVTETEDYIHAESRSRLFRFVDDLEIWIDVDGKLLHARSASRTGYSDLGVNRKRVEQLFARLTELIGESG